MAKANPDGELRESGQPLPACAQGLALLTLGRVEEAREVLEAALARSPLSIEVRRTLARLRAAMGDGAGAQRLLEGAVQLAPRDMATVCDLVLLYARQRDGMARARRLLDAALEVNETEALTHLTYARVVAQDAPTQALFHARQALAHGDGEVREAAAWWVRRLAS
ncbi:tetratricopeptide repeat protein [Myxococcaceae bacterium JPH2]|nr:tetratricopeptide repeat protein [Myxococcaceae bacterium JPH2]